MRRSQTYYIFISHSWNYDDEYERLVNMLDNAEDFNWKNYSLPYYKGKGPRSNSKLSDSFYYQMKRTQIVIVIAGMYVAYSDWIQKEIDIALQFRKPILGVYPWGSRITPSVVTDVADDMVGWRTDSIIDGIRRLVR